MSRLARIPALLFVNKIDRGRPGMSG